MSARNRRRWVRRFAGPFLAIGVLAFTILLLDGAMRWVLPIPQPGAGEWAGTPGTELLFTSAPDAFETTHRYNDQGFRGPGLPIERTNKTRIVCIGDSWTEGIGADEDHAWPVQLGKRFADEGVPTEVLNLGDAGASPTRYMEILTQVGVPLKPDQVIVCVIPSDFWGGVQLPESDEVRHTLRDDFRDRESYFGSLAARCLPAWTFLIDRAQGRWHHRNGIYWQSWELPEAWLVAHIANLEGISADEAKERLVERLSFVEPQCIDGAESRVFNGHRIAQELWNPHASFRCGVGDMGVTEEALRESVEIWIARYAEVCRQSGIEPVLCLFPEAGMVSELPSGPMIDAWFDAAPVARLDDSLSRMLSAECQKYQVHFLDVTPDLRSYASEHGGQEPLFLRYDTHPNSKGYAVAAAAIHRWLKKSAEERAVYPAEKDQSEVARQPQQAPASLNR